MKVSIWIHQNKIDVFKQFFDNFHNGDISNLNELSNCWFNYSPGAFYLQLIISVDEYYFLKLSL